MTFKTYSRRWGGVLVSACLGASTTGCVAYHPAPLAVAPAPTARAIMTPPDGPLSVDALVTQAILANPDLKIAAAQANVVDAEAFASRLLPDPTGNLGFSSPLSGPDTMLALAGAIGFDLSALRTRGARMTEATARKRQVRLDLAWTAWQVGAQVRLQAARICAYDRIVAIDQTSADVSQDLLRHALASAARHDIPADRLGTVRLAALDSADRLRGSQRDRLTARYVLAALLGQPTPLAAPLLCADAPSSPGDAAALADGAIRDRPDLAALRAGYDVQEAGLRKAVLDQFPAFSVGIGAGRDSGGARTIGPTVSFTLPLWNRNRGGIAIASASRAALRAEYEARVTQARSAIEAAVAGIHLAERQRAAVTAALPDLAALARTNRMQATRGDLPQTVAAATEQAERDRRRLLAESDLAIAEQSIILGVLTGTAGGAQPQ